MCYLSILCLKFFYTYKLVQFIDITNDCFPYQYKILACCKWPILDHIGPTVSLISLAGVSDASPFNVIAIRLSVRAQDNCNK